MVNDVEKLTKEIKVIKGQLKKSKKKKGFKKQAKFLTKPTAKGPTPISARKTLKGFAQSSGPMVREVPPRELVKDERSLYFKKEYEKEGSKWLG